MITELVSSFTINSTYEMGPLILFKTPFTKWAFQTSMFIYEKKAFGELYRTLQFSAQKLIFVDINIPKYKISGIARLGHTGARALATWGRAPPVQVCNWIIGTDSIVVDRKSGAMVTVCKFAISDLRNNLRTDLGGCKILGEQPPDHPKCCCALRRCLYKCTSCAHAVP